MKHPYLVPAIWSCIASGAFALGWWSKPQHDESSGTRRDAGAFTEAGLSSPSAPGGSRQKNGTGKAAALTKPILAQPLTSASIASLGLEFRKTMDPILKREAFAKLLAGLTPENALEIRQQIEHLDQDDPNFRDFHFAWGKIGGRAAVMHGAETDKRDMGPTLAGWASADPAAARAWYDSLQDKGRPNRDGMKEAFVHGLAIADPAKAVDFVMELGKAGDPRSKQMMSIVAEKIIKSGGTSAAAAWAAGLPGGDLRGHALYDVSRAMVRDNPAAAAAWATTQTGDKNGGAIVYGISSEWASRDGAAAVKWLDSLTENQSTGYGPAMAGWAKADPLAASQHIASMPPSENRNHAIQGLVYTHRWEDPVSSIAWAGQISDTKGRQDALTLAAEAYLRKDPAGAAAWLPVSGLPEATQQRLTTGKK